MPVRFWSVDLTRFRRNSEVNYLHAGEILDGWRLHQDVEIARKQLEARANHFNHRGTEASPSRPISASRRFAKEPGWANPDRLLQSLSESLEWRSQFHQLGCRGFSYSLDLGMAQYDSLRPPAGHLSSRIDFRLALMPSRDLFYPSAVSRYFDSQRWRGNHYYQKGAPSIAFCFGRTIDRTLYILNMQSDLSSSAPSAVREHFRGWRTVLFANIVAQARGKADRIRVCLANDVVRGCFRGTRETTGGPSARWKSIYDGTAEDWQMRTVTTRAPINIQLYKGQRSVYAHRFHQLSLRTPRPSQEDGSCTKAAAQGDASWLLSGEEQIRKGIAIDQSP